MKPRDRCRICRNTVINTHRRWVKAGRPGEYLRFLQRRYAPTNGATNDPHGLNRHWEANVRQLYQESRSFANPQDSR